MLVSASYHWHTHEATLSSKAQSTRTNVAGPSPSVDAPETFRECSQCGYHAARCSQAKIDWQIAASVRSVWGAVLGSPLGGCSASPNRSARRVALLAGVTHSPRLDEHQLQVCVVDPLTWPCTLCSRRISAGRKQCPGSGSAWERSTTNNSPGRPIATLYVLLLAARSVRG